MSPDAYTRLIHSMFSWFSTGLAVLSPNISRVCELYDSFIWLLIDYNLLWFLLAEIFVQRYTGMLILRRALKTQSLD